MKISIIFEHAGENEENGEIGWMCEITAVISRCIQKDHALTDTHFGCYFYTTLKKNSSESTFCHRSFFDTGKCTSNFILFNSVPIFIIFATFSSIFSLWIFNIYFLVRYGMCSIRSCLVWTWFFNSISSRFFCIWLFVMDKNSMCGALSSYTLCSVCSKKSRTPWLIQYSATFHNFSWKILTRVGFLYEAHLKTDHDSFSF